MTRVLSSEKTATLDSPRAIVIEAASRLARPAWLKSCSALEE
jgi:hypothetical protein